MLRSYIGGIFGGLTIIAIFMLIVFNTNLFNYNVKINIGTNTIEQVKETDKLKLLKELEKEKIIVSPEQFTSNVISYYNTALTIMAALIIVFSIVSYVHLQFISREQVSTVFKENVKDSIEFQTFLNDTLLGRADEKFALVESVEELEQKLNDYDIEGFSNRLKVLESKVNNENGNKDEYIEE